MKALADLQKVDLEIVVLRKSAEVYPRQMGELERELSLAKGEVEAERTKLLDVERQRRTLEQNIVEEKDKVRKWETRLSEQRSTREYAALAREIDIAKKANGTMAEELLELGKMQAQLRELLKGKEQQYAVRVGDVGGKLNELRVRVAGFEGQVKELEGKRADVAKAVHPPLLSRYETVRKRRTPALVTVIA
ncbi:MAG: zinc ribbon domain-containing protein, partial [Myxococcaceae bacterium]